MIKKLLPIVCALLCLCSCASGSGYGADWTTAPVTFTPMPTATPQPTVTPTPAAEPEPFVLREQVPILMYHQIAAPEENDLYLSPEDFRSQLDWLEAHGFTPVTMAELSAHWTRQQSLPERPIVLTFDDGYRPMYTEVFPRLREKGWSATFYMIADAVHDPAAFLDEAALREMAEAGMEIGSHTMHHEQLTDLSPERAAEELRDSRAALEAVTGRPVTSFCYPSGRYTEELARQVWEQGYESAVTTEYALAGTERDIFLLPRLRISAGMDGPALGRLLDAAGVL